MDLELTEEQKVIQKAARDFAEGEFDEEMILEYQEKKLFPFKVLRKAGKLGFIGVSYSSDFGGQDYGLFENALIIEEFCKKDSELGIALSSVDRGAELISKFGNNGQKERFLFPITKGEAISSLVCPGIEGGAEGSSGTVLAGKKSDRYVLHGEILYVLNGSLANFFIVHCRNDFEKPGSGQWPVFVILEKGKTGLNIVPMGDKLGMAMLSWDKLILEEINISKDDTLGGIGFDPLCEIRKTVMVKTGVQALGIAQGAFDRALAYSKQREQFGRKIGQFQSIRHKLVDMHVRIEAARSLVYSVALQYDRGKTDLRDALAANLFAEMVAIEVTDEALQVFGGAGYMIETPVEHFFRDARILRTISGRQHPKKDVIADSIIGRIA